MLQLNDRVPDFQKFPVMVKASEAEKNYLAKQASLPGFDRCFSDTKLKSAIHTEYRIGPSGAER